MDGKNILGRINPCGDNVHGFPLLVFDENSSFHHGAFDVARGDFAASSGRGSPFHSLDAMPQPSKCRRLCLMALVLFGVGCAGMRAVVHPPPDLVVLGKTTMAQVVDRYGVPSQVLDRNYRNTRVRTLQYMQAFDPNDKPNGAEIYGSRTASFFFVDNVLVGHNFESSFSSDSTDFDLNLATQIKPGISTRTQVIKAFGEPVGYYQFPFVEEPGQKALTYLYLATSFTKAGVGHVRKEVIITYDTSDIIRSIRYQLRDGP